MANMIKGTRHFFCLIELLCSLSLYAQNTESTQMPELYSFLDSWETNTYDYDLQVRMDRYNSLSKTFETFSFISYIGGMFAYDSYVMSGVEDYKINPKDMIFSFLCGVLAASPCAILAQRFKSNSKKLSIQAKTYSNNIPAQDRMSQSPGIEIAFNITF